MENVNPTGASLIFGFAFQIDSGDAYLRNKESLAVSSLCLVNVD